MASVRAGRWRNARSATPSARNACVAALDAPDARCAWPASTAGDRHARVGAGTAGAPRASQECSEGHRDSPTPASGPRLRAPARRVHRRVTRGVAGNAADAVHGRDRGPGGRRAIWERAAGGEREPGKGIDGRRRTRHRAQAAMSVELHGYERVTRYAADPLLVVGPRDELLHRSLRRSSPTPAVELPQGQGEVMPRRSRCRARGRQRPCACGRGG